MRGAGLAPALNELGDWRSAGLAAAAVHVDSPTPYGWPLVLGLALAILVALRPRPGSRAQVAWLGCLVVMASLGGMLAGEVRLAAIDRGALAPVPGERTVRATVASVPREGSEGVRFRVDSTAGRFLVSLDRLDHELPIGREIEVTGPVRRADEWRTADLRRHGIEAVIDARRLRLTGASRGGLAGWLDGVRDRAEAGIERGMPPAAAALARGFVLGQDDRVDREVVEEFRRSGLAHLLAVSGQNVMLLALLAAPALAMLGLGLRSRLIGVALLIAVYVPVAGAGPSIQRAGVMGAAGIAATLAGRPHSRVYAVLLAAFVTLALNPRSVGDVGWQLSFAAVVGIAAWASGIREWMLGRLGGSGSASAGYRALAEGAALTVSATVATAPLMAAHFEAVPIAALPANVLALPAVAPVMWLGMISAAVGQLPGLPTDPLNALNAALIGYIAQIARWFAAPDWALLNSPSPSIPVLAAAYAAMFGGGLLLSRIWRRRGGLGPRAPLRLALTGAAVLSVLLAAGALQGESVSSSAQALRVTVLDVGQGDSILLDPPRGDPVLVDAGPPGSGVARRLRGLGVERLSGLVITHDQLDHTGGAQEVLDGVEVASLVTAQGQSTLREAARRSGIRTVAASAGRVLRSGRLELEVLWPLPGAAIDAENPNETSIVLLARWRHFTMLLTGDAEAEVAPVDPGSIDVLKVAHHGSADAGLAGLLARAKPALAVISVGAGNPHRHPSDETLEALAEWMTPVVRTDRDGELSIWVERAGWRAMAEDAG